MMNRIRLTALVFLLIFSSHTLKNKAAYRAAVAAGQDLFLPEDLEATLWAESPQFFNPTNIDVDLKGRIWVTEAVNYRDFNNSPEKVKHHEAGDRVMILEDSDGDGVADKSKIFVQDKDLRSPLGIAVFEDKIVVSCAPAIIIYTDANHDDVPDKKEIFLTGFGGYDHDHGLHSVLAGPDGRWYFNTGNSGPHQVQDKAGWHLRSGSMYTGGTPYAKSNTPGLVSDDGRIWVGGLALRIGKDGKGLEVLGHNFRNAYELAVDSYGNMWQNDNDDQVVACRTSWVMEGGNAGYFSPDGSRAWQADKRPGQEVFTAHWHQNDPGVMPAGDNTGAGSPTGITINESDLLGKKYRGLLLSADAGRNVIFGYYPQMQGAGFKLDRTNFISSLKQVNEEYIWHKTDEDKTKWFRPSDVALGTDGAIYVADWYDPIVGGHQMHDAQGYGRIYRIAPKGKKLSNPDINLKTTKGQIQALLNPAVNVRNAGFEALKSQGNKAFKPVKALLKAENPYHRARAVWLLAQLGEKGKKEVENLLPDSDEAIRITAYRALRQVDALNMLVYAARLARDNSAAVRREVAISLRDLSFDQTGPILLHLAQSFDGRDRAYLEALGTGADKKEEPLYAALLSNQEKADPLQWQDAFAQIVWRLHPVSAIPALHQRAKASSLNLEQRQLALETLAFIKNEKAALAMADLSSQTATGLAGQAQWWLQFRQTNDWLAYTIPGWENKGNGKSSEVRQKMLTLQTNLQETNRPLQERIAIALEMAQHEIGGQLLISLASQNKLSPEIIKGVSKAIFTNPDQNVRVLASDYFKRPGGEKTLSIPKIAQLKAQVETGKVLFGQKCASCHKVGSTGAEIGPELTLIRKKFDKPGLLDAVVNPSAAMAFGYEPWLITTKEGQATYGFLQADGETVILKDTGGKRHVFKKENIAARKQFTTSIMPDPITLGLSEQDLANISEYLLQLPNN